MTRKRQRPVTTATATVRTANGGSCAADVQARALHVTAALDGLPIQHAEAELSAAAGCPGAVPLELFESAPGG